jgi:spermidine synthase
MENFKTTENLFVEKVSENFTQISTIKNCYLQNHQTKFQKMDIYELGSFGKCLILDNLIQSAKNDEYIYHEALVHPTLVNFIPNFLVITSFPKKGFNCWWW